MALQGSLHQSSPSLASSSEIGLVDDGDALVVASILKAVDCAPPLFTFAVSHHATIATREIWMKASGGRSSHQEQMGLSYLGLQASG